MLDTLPDRPLLTRADVPDCLWPSECEFDIPILDIRLQGDFVDKPVVTWGSVKRAALMRGIWSFYTDDYRFTALISDPTPIINSGCNGIIEPNFSTHSQNPAALVIYRTYQKRWLTRYCQHYGIRVFVDMNVAPCWMEYNLLGVPCGWRAYATRGYNEHLEATAFEYECAVQRAQTEDIIFVVVGGGQAVRERCASEGWWWVPECMDVRKGKHTHGG